MVRLTKEKTAQLLEENDGFEVKTYYEGKNFRETRYYTIHDGKLTYRSVGKTSWADSHFDNEVECDYAQTRRFLHNWILDD